MSDLAVCSCGAKLPPERRGRRCVECTEAIYAAATTPPKVVPSTDPTFYTFSDGSVELTWNDDRTSTEVSRELLDGMVEAHNKNVKARMWVADWLLMSERYLQCDCNKSARWKKGFDFGVEAGKKVGSTYAMEAKLRERFAIVAWLRDGEFSGGYVDGIADAVENALHLRGDEHKPNTVCYRCDECKAEKLDAERAAFQRGSEHGQRFEREAVVAWLRSFIDPDGEVHLDLDDLALIKRGEHRGADDE